MSRLKKTSTKIGKPKKKKSEAEKAVTEFEEVLEEYETEVAAWREEYKEAASSLDTLEEMRAEVIAKSNAAKQLVSKEGGTIGRFILTERRSSPKYCGEKLLNLIKKRKISDKQIAGLFRKKAVALVKIDQSMAKLLVDVGDENLQQVLSDIFDPGGDLVSNAVTVPKWDKK